MKIEKICVSQIHDQFINQSEPIIILNALDNWSLGELWRPQYLAEIAGHREIRASIGTTRKFGYKPDSNGSVAPAFNIKKMDFASAVRIILDQNNIENLYVMQQDVYKQLPEIAKNIITPRWIESKDIIGSLWLGRNTVTPLHYDISNNLFAQLNGKKKFTLFSPNDTPYLYPYRHDSTMPHLSYFDVNEPDLANYQNSLRAKPIQVELEAGELLYLPSLWWHQVEAKDVSTSLSFWWLPSLSQFIESPSAGRALYYFYGVDKLEQFEKNLMKPANLNFLEAAKFALSKQQKWASCLMAIVGLIEVAAILRKKPRKKSEGNFVSNLSHEIQDICNSVSGIEEVQEIHNEMVSLILDMERNVVLFDDGVIDETDVLRLLAITEEMRAAAMTVPQN